MNIDDFDDIAHHNGWTFDPAREVWWARTGPDTWTEVKGTLDDPPAWAANGWAPPRDRYVGPRSTSVDERGATIREGN